METRANHIVIGAFVLVVVFGLFGFVLWLAKIEVDQQFSHYSVIFDEAVSGLSVGGDVRYSGIPVGTVTDIRIDPRDPGRVEVTLEVAADTPVKLDTIAKLELQGITGVAFVQLTGGTAMAGTPKPGPNGEPATLRSERSAIQAFVAGAPELINHAIILVDAITELVNEKNRARFEHILANVDEVSTRLAKRGPELEQILVDFQKITAQTNQLTARLNGLVDSSEATLSMARGTISIADGLIDEDMRKMLADLSTASKRFEAVGKDLQILVAENREGLTAFTNDGLLELTRFLEESRTLVTSASRLVEDLKSDPANFLFGGQQEGFEAE